MFFKEIFTTQTDLLQALVQSLDDTPPNRDLGSIPGGILGKWQCFDQDMQRAQCQLTEDPINATDARCTEEIWRLAVASTILYGEMNLPLWAETIDLTQIDNKSKRENLFLRLVKQALQSDYHMLRLILCGKRDGTESPFALASPYIVTPVSGIHIPVRSAADCPFPLDFNNVDIPQVIGAGVTNYLTMELSDLVYPLKQALLHIRDSGVYPRALFFINRFLTDLPVLGLEGYRGPRRIGAPPLVELCGYEPYAPLRVAEVFTDQVYLFEADAEDTPWPMFASCYGTYAVKEGDRLSDYTALLPLRKTFAETYLNCIERGGLADLSWLEGDDQRRGFSMEMDDNGLTACFYLKAGGDLLRLSHTYDKKAIMRPSTTSDYARLPGVAVWPDKIDPEGSWHDYYLFQTEGETTANAYVGLWFKPSEQCGLMAKTHLVKGQNGKRFCTAHTIAFPYFLYAEKDGVYHGLLILKPKGALQNNRRAHFLLGMDFGTTSNTAFISDTSAKEADWLYPQRLSFKDNSVLAAVSPIALRDTQHYAFVADNASQLSSRASPFFTIWHTFDDNAEENVLLNGHILFFGATFLKMPDFGDIPLNIKWSENNLYADQFIEQFLQLCIWKSLEKGAGRLSIRFAYPASQPNASTIQARVTKAIDKLYIRVSALETATESRASMLYFQNTTLRGTDVDLYEKADIEKGVLLLDIGGGSTDIALIQSLSSGRLNFKFAESSLTLAGKSILTEMLAGLRTDLKRFKTLMRYLGVEKGLIETADHYAIQPHDSDEDEKRRAVLFQMYCELCLTYMKTPVIQNTSGMDDADGIFDRIERMITFNLCAIAFYSGKLAQEVSLSSAWRERIFTFTDAMSVVVCGNGSKLFDWIYDDDRNLVTCCFLDGADKFAQELTVDLIQSRQPKEEVAGGLVSVKDLDRYPGSSAISFFDQNVVSETGVRETIVIDAFIEFFLSFIHCFKKATRGTLNEGLLSGEMFDDAHIVDLIRVTIRACRKRTLISEAYALTLKRINKYFQKKILESEDW